MPNPPVPRDDPRGHGQLRASDADRELVAETLRQAAGDGRITLGELDQRLEAVQAAKTYAEMEKLTEDSQPPEASRLSDPAVPPPRGSGSR